MAGVLVGGAFLSSFLNVLFDRMATTEFMDFFRGQKLDDALLKKLKVSFLAINAVLNDAEEKQITNLAVKAWLDELKDAVYEAEDLFDEIATEALRCKLEGKSQTTIIKVRNFFSTSLNPFAESIESKVNKIIERLENIATQKDVLGLKTVGGRLSRRLPTTSLEDESDVYGRDDDKERIVEFLLLHDLSSAEISVISIVGMGGVGKTTLAQVLFNDERVSEHFDMKAWACVSEEFDVFKVTRTIYEAVSSSTCESKDLDMVQRRLKEKLTSRKFLLVLDDIWNENYNDWDVLRKPLRYGERGSRIIVTTRSERVASIMCTTPIYHLRQLSDDDCWSLFAKHAFAHGNSSVHSNLKEIGKEIVKKCKGLPLAAKTLGGLLRSEEDAEEWDKILKSNIWDLPTERTSILPALWLSYYYLPPHLKRCFSYCSIFPKDYEFDKKQLILLWMAEDLLQEPKRNRSLEELGDEYFHDLTMRSFFQRSSGNEMCYVMHDLLSDLANFVSGESCFRLENNVERNITTGVRHFSYSRCYSYNNASEIMEVLYGAKHLRTYLPLDSSLEYLYYHLNNKQLNDMLPKFRCLRVLSLSSFDSISSIPDSIGDLKHLRYLDLSHTPIKSLPDSISTLYNLQTLILSDCRSLLELPANIERLVNLRYLDISGANSIKEMPLQMSRLTGLRTLSTFILGQRSGSRIKQLGEFQHLRGKLSILELQNVVHANDAFEAYLKNKKYLDELVLEWSPNTEDSQNERDVLANLRPNACLKRLTINYYGGTQFPDWVGDHSFSKIVYLSLYDCKYCFSLPPVGQLPCLKELIIVGFEGVEKVGLELYGDGSSSVKPFGSLEILVFEKMPEWEEWSFGDEGGEFPCLRELHIRECPKLTGGLPNRLPSLTKLEIRKCQQLEASLPRAPAILKLSLSNCDKVVWRSNDGLALQAQPSPLVPAIPDINSHPCDQIMTTLPSQPLGLQSFCSLVELEISGLSELKELPPMLHLLPIKHLHVSFCPCLECFPEGGLPASLKFLHLEYCKNLELLLPAETVHSSFASLETLTVQSSCDSLISFPLALFPKLNDLEIRDCINLESFCISEAQREGGLTSLRTLTIEDCHKLESFPEGGFPIPNLTYFKVSKCKDLKSLPERMHTLLPSLDELRIIECPEVELFPEGALPSTLSTLVIVGCHKLMARLMEWGLRRLPSLDRLAIGSQEVESFPDEQLLPSTLTYLEIVGFPNMKCMNARGLKHLTSLKDLRLRNCSNLQCLPGEGLPASLAYLTINQCPLLKEQCQREKGKDWPIIAGIPCVMIDGEYVS